MGATGDFYTNPECRNCKDIRMACNSVNVMLVEGLEGVSDQSLVDEEESLPAKSLWSSM